MLVVVALLSRTPPARALLARRGAATKLGGPGGVATSLARRGAASLVDAAWLRARADDPRVRVFDVSQVLDRETNVVAPARAAFDAAHVPAATFLDVGGALSAPHVSLHNMAPAPEAFAAALGENGVDDSCHVVLSAARVENRAGLETKPVSAEPGAPQVFRVQNHVGDARLVAPGRVRV